MANELASWVAAIADITSAGIATPMIKIGTDVSYYHLGNTEKVSVKLNPLSGEDVFLRDWGYGWMLEMNLTSLQASAVEIARLHWIALAREAFVRFTVPNGMIIDTAPLTVCPKMGIGWKLTCGGGFNGFRKIEYTFKCAYKPSELATILVAAGAGSTIGAVTVGDNLGTWSHDAVPANQATNGIAKIEVRNVGDTNYIDLGAFTDDELTIETHPGITNGSGRGKPWTTTIKINGGAILREVSQTKLELLQYLLRLHCEVRLTLTDGVVLTLDVTDGFTGTSKINVVTGGDFSGSIEDAAGMPLKIKGTIPIYTTTNWTGLWAEIIG